MRCLRRIRTVSEAARTYDEAGGTSDEIGGTSDEAVGTSDETVRTWTGRSEHGQGGSLMTVCACGGAGVRPGLCERVRPGAGGPAARRQGPPLRRLPQRPGRDPPAVPRGARAGAHSLCSLIPFFSPCHVVFPSSHSRWHRLNKPVALHGSPSSENAERVETPKHEDPEGCMCLRAT